ncbi:MAG: tagaturonate epimerase family protein [Planctomycetota bacterium]
MNSQKPTALNLQPTFGFGDRLGGATPGHIAALRHAGGDIRAIFAQQSIREMARTNREPHQVMQDAADALAAADYEQPWGSDADHLKTQLDVDRMMQAGFTFFTIDPSDHVDQQADNYSAEQVRERYRRREWVNEYADQVVDLPDGNTLTLDPDGLERAAVKYAAAIDHAIKLGLHIQRAAEQMGRKCEIELSVDETSQPTKLLEHYVIADQLRRAGVGLVSLAPRFIGELEKGIDFIGDVAAFEASVAQHAAIAQKLGPYKLSLHSGSDKLSIYPAFAQATSGLFHVKTAGTSYLEALRVVARRDETLFRRIVSFSRDRYEIDRATYHVHATLNDAPPEADVADIKELESHYLELWDEVEPGKGFTKPGRQILHCTFGSVVTEADLGPGLSACLHRHPDTYLELLDEHFGRHLRALS